MGSLTKSKIVTLNCNLANKNSNNTYTTSIGQLAIESVNSLSLKSCSFRNIFYNVVGTGSRKNNIFYFLLDGVPQEVIINEGFYNISDLLTVLKLEINNKLVLSGIVPLPVLTTLTYDNKTAKVTISVDGGGAGTGFTLQGGDFELSINRLLGNNINKDLDLLIPEIYVFNNVIDLSGLDTVQVVCNTIADNNGFGTLGFNNFGRVSSIVRQIDIDAPFKGIQTYISRDTDADAVLYSQPIDLSRITISLEDKYGNTLDLQGTNFNLEIIIYI